jgi:hypothetical protein
MGGRNQRIWTAMTSDFILNGPENQQIMEENPFLLLLLWKLTFFES